jgi:tight adherence protein C
MLIELLPWIAFGVVAIVVFGIGRWLLVRNDDESARLTNGARRPQTLIFGPLTGAFAGILPVIGGSRASLDQDLRRAGYYKRRAADEYLALRNVMVFGALLLTASWLVASADIGERMTLKVVVIGLCAMVVLFAVPRLFIQWQGRRRIQRIQVGLPDALDILTMCLTSGLPLQTALNRVNGPLYSAHPDLAYELDILRRQSDAGSMEHALEQFSQRVDAPEIRTLTSLVSHAERLGTNVGAVIREYADGLRRSHRQRAEERGNRITVQMLFPIALCLAPASYILLLGPPVIEMRDFLLRENRAGGILSPADIGQAAALPQTGVVNRPTAAPAPQP